MLTLNVALLLNASLYGRFWVQKNRKVKARALYGLTGIKAEEKRKGRVADKDKKNARLKAKEREETEQ